MESQANLQRTCGEKVDPFCGSDVYNVTLIIVRWKGRARREFTWQEFTRKEESELTAMVHWGTVVLVTEALGNGLIQEGHQRGGFIGRTVKLGWSS